MDAVTALTRAINLDNEAKGITAVITDEDIERTIRDNRFLRCMINTDQLGNIPAHLSRECILGRELKGNWDMEQQV